MSRVSALLLALSLSACAVGQTAPDLKASSHDAMAGAMNVDPVVSPEPVPLPVLSPPTRLQSELEALPHAAIARWIFPEPLASRFVRSELLRGRMPRPGGIAFYQIPRATGLPGVCEVERTDVWLRVPNENSLTYQQHLDPALQPYQYFPILKWKLVGSTDPAQAGKAPDCAAALPSGDWFEAPSAAAVHRAASLVERAQARPRGVRLLCNQMRYDEALQDFGYPPCADPAAMLARLTPDLIKRVRPADCTVKPSPTGCLGIEYHDPAAPGTHSFYLVTVPDSATLDYVQISQGMLPPH